MICNNNNNENIPVAYVLCRQAVGTNPIKCTGCGYIRDVVVWQAGCRMSM